MHAGRLAGHAYAGSLCASAGTGNTGKYPAAGGKHGVDGMTARYGVPAGGLCEGALSPVLNPCRVAVAADPTYVCVDPVGPCKRSAAGQCAQSTTKSPPPGKPRVRHARNNSEVVTQINAAGTARSAERLAGQYGNTCLLEDVRAAHGGHFTEKSASGYGSALRWC